MKAGRLARGWALLLTLLFASTAVALRAAEPATAPVETYYLLVFNQPVPGKEQEYNSWYDRHHAPDVVSVPGFVRAQRYVFASDAVAPGAGEAQVPRDLPDQDQ